MLRIPSAVCLVFLGCCLNVLVLEELTNNLNGVANLITFLQFAFIALEGFIFTTKFGSKKPAVPPRNCYLLVILFFVSSVCNNYAYNFNVPTTLHIIIKSGSLVTNMAVGLLVAGRRYSKKKYIGVLLVTLGITICTLTSAKKLKDVSDLPEIPIKINFMWWSIGIFLLVIALVIGAIMGLVQENIYAKYGKHPQDVLYYTHLLPLPLFSFLYSDLLFALQLCSDNQTLDIPLLDMDISVWFLLFLNVSSQYVCIRSVYVLSSECSALSVNLVLTLRKFISLLLSVIVFENMFNISHCIGTVCVFAGTAMYSDILHVR